MQYIKVMLILCFLLGKKWDKKVRVCLEFIDNFMEYVSVLLFRLMEKMLFFNLDNVDLVVYVFVCKQYGMKC